MNSNLPRLTAITADRLLNDLVASRRSRWAVVKAKGSTVRDYLQGQITQDMARLRSECGIHTCLLTPQGKAISELYIFEGNDEELLLLAPCDIAVEVVGRLRRFAVGHELRCGMVESMGVCTVQGAHAQRLLNAFNLEEPGEGWLASSHASSDCHAVVMPEQPRGFWIIADQSAIDTALASVEATDENEFEAMRIIRGYPDFGIEWNEKVHPLNANLIEFEGVSFDKGCYVGQEVTARMNWRGGIKKRLYRVSIDGTPLSLPCPIRTTANIGELKSAAIDHEGNCFGIAYLPIEVAESGAELSLESGEAVKLLEACHV